jgi:Fic family protein
MANRYQDLDDRSEDLRELMRARRDVTPQFQELFELSWIHHDNGLEGIVVTGAEMQAALSPLGPVAPDSSTNALYKEIRNHKAAIDFIRAEAQGKKVSINLTLVRKLHELLCEGFENREKGAFRKDMPLHRTYFHEIMQPAKIPAGLDKVLDATTTAEFRESHPLKQAAQVHHAFMQVFPFTDNSGKIARLLGNLLLLRAEMLPALIHTIDRQKYYESLKQPPTTLRNLYFDALENALENATRFFEGAPKQRRKKAANQ